MLHEAHDRMANLSLGNATDGQRLPAGLARGGERPVMTSQAASTMAAGHEMVLQNQLAQARLGVAAALFAALRAKHPATAAHSLRVALLSSAWAEALNACDIDRDELEIAALLHDVGKIGVPDCVLLKPGRLTAEEMEVLECSQDFACEMLACCCTSAAVVQIVQDRVAWYDGSRRLFPRRGTDLPRAARMLAIADAYDAMTSDSVFRQGIAGQRAVGELRAWAGTQFDPELVESFLHFLQQDQEAIHRRVAHRWLQRLKENGANEFWRLQDTKPVHERAVIDGLFHRHLLNHMNDAVMLIDVDFNVLRWNRAAEMLTGRSAAEVIDTKWDPALVELRDEHLKLVGMEKCPVTEALRTGATFQRRYHVTNGKGDKVAVSAVISPIAGSDGITYGATMILRDASSEAVLQQRVESLHAQATQDPLTGVANRAEFDRALRDFVRTQTKRGTPGSLMICDLDFFKRINDRFGHQAGDEAIITFASLLQKFAQPDDLVARYGGEEFVMLCNECNVATTTDRAEQIRQALAARPQLMMGGKCITASFGVTELQPGDTPESMLRRADQALLQAKENGRNAVVRIGGITGDTRHPSTSRSWFGWRHDGDVDSLLERQLITSVPLGLAAEKLRGFITDHHAQVLTLQQNQVSLNVAGKHVPATRRRGDRPTDFRVDLQFEEVHIDRTREGKGIDVRTIVQVKIRPKRKRDRRSCEVIERARLLFISVKSYLAAQDYLEAWR